VTLCVDDKYVATLTVGKYGLVRISKDSDTGKALISALNEGRRIRLFSSE
jgi:predicted PilT family ATPase